MARGMDIATRRRVYIRPTLPQRLVQTCSSVTARPPSLVHRFSLLVIWLAVATGAIVFTEPAPTDALTMAAIVLLPVVGLAVFRPPVLAMGAVLLTICALGFTAALVATDTAKAATHTAITVYLSLAAVVIAAFVSKNPQRHTRLILRAHLVAALVASVAALAGYFELFDGAKELFTKFDRASGTFKDPNVLGPFLVPALVYALHVWLNTSFVRGLPALGALAVLAVAILLSFSRGAWAGAAIAVAIYLYFTFVTSRRMLDRFRVAALTVAGIGGLVMVVLVALQFEEIADLFMQRAALAQTYDVGPEGRFGGQLKAIDVLLSYPFGIGALEFPRHFHHEDVHNVYLSLFLNTGWLGGLLFIALMAYTLVRGLGHALKRSRYQGYFLIAYAALAATLLQGFLIDIDHWRHYYALLGIVWALMAVDRPAERENRIVRDRRPILMQPMIILAPTRRTGRIIGPAPKVIEFAPRRQRQIGDFNRNARILRPIAPRRLTRMWLTEGEVRARLRAGGNDNLPLSSR